MILIKYRDSAINSNYFSRSYILDGTSNSFPDSVQLMANNNYYSVAWAVTINNNSMPFVSDTHSWDVGNKIWNTCNAPAIIEYYGVKYIK